MGLKCNLSFKELFKIPTQYSFIKLFFSKDTFPTFLYEVHPVTRFMIHLHYKRIVFLLSINILVPLLGKKFFTIFHHIQDLQESTAVLKKDEVMLSDNRKITKKTMLMEDTSKEHVSHQKPVSHAEILYDGRKSTEIDSLQISKLEDSSKESKLSSGYFSMSENLSEEKPSRALVMTGKKEKKKTVLTF